MHTKKLLILGGSYNAIQILETAQSLGYKVGVVDYYAKSVCKSKAEYSYNIDIFNTTEIVELIKSEKYDGLLTGYSDILLQPYINICQLAGLNCYLNPTNLELSIDKSLTKSICKRYHIPVLEEYDLESLNKNPNLLPVVIKPVDAAGASGITFCNKLSDLHLAYEKALTHSTSGNVIIEKKATGKEITLFYYIQNSTPHLLAYGDRIISIPPSQHIPLPRGYIFPAHIDLQLINRFDHNLRNMLHTEHFAEGPLYVQAFAEPDDIYLCEIGYRLTPSFENFGIKHCCGFDSIEALVKYAVDDTHNFSSLHTLNPDSISFANLTLLLKSGIIAEFKGIDEVEKLSYVIKVLPAWEPGHEIKKINCDTLAQIGIRVIISGSSQSDLLKKMNHVQSILSVRDIHNNEMIIKDFNYTEI